jgi:hypothetical protein
VLTRESLFLGNLVNKAPTRRRLIGSSNLLTGHALNHMRVTAWFKVEIEHQMSMGLCCGC